MQATMPEAHNAARMIQEICRKNPVIIDNPLLIQAAGDRDPVVRARPLTDGCLFPGQIVLLADDTPLKDLDLG